MANIYLLTNYCLIVYRQVLLIQLIILPIDSVIFNNWNIFIEFTMILCYKCY